jgi:hypothetical protein
VRALRVAILVLAAAPVACSLFVDLSGLDDGGLVTDGGATDVLTSVGDAASDAAAGCAADVTKDPKNCGQCGHDCLTATCTNGACDSVTLTHASTYVDSLACDESAVYFITDDKVLLRKAIDATPATTLVGSQIANATSPFGIAVDATHVFYFSSASGEQVARVTKDASVIENIAPVPLNLEDTPEAISVDDASVYVSTFDLGNDGGGRLVSFDKTPDASPNFLYTRQASAFESVQATGSIVYLQEDGLVVSVPIGGGNSTTLTTNQYRSADNQSFGWNSGGVGWATGNGGAVEWRASDSANISLIDAGSGAQCVAMDETNLYAALTDPTDASASGGTIVAVSLSAGTRTTIAKGQANPRLLTLCPTYLAWLVDDGAASAIQILAR